MGGLLRPPAAFSELLRCMDPVEDGARVAIADDLLRPDFPKSGFREAVEFLDSLLADPAVSNADLKGLLNRETSSMWAAELGFDSMAMGARRCLEALREAIVRHEGGG
jgi:hypothetical protein